MFFGSIPALVTPFSGNCVDEDSLRDLVEWQIDEGSNALVPCGTTGEGATLSIDEHRRVIAITVETVVERPSRDRVAVVAGTGTNDTAASIAATRRAAALGADAALVVAPYYNRPDGRMLEAHFRAVVDELQRVKPAAAKGRYIKRIAISSTMGPGVKVDPNRIKPEVAETASA